MESYVSLNLNIFSIGVKMLIICVKVELVLDVDIFFSEEEP